MGSGGEGVAGDSSSCLMRRPMTSAGRTALGAEKAGRPFRNCPEGLQPSQAEEGGRASFVSAPGDGWLRRS